MNKYITKLREAVSEAGAESVLDIVYRCYQDIHPIENEEIRDAFQCLDGTLGKLTLKECDQVWDLACSLCGQYEKLGFMKGVRAGMRLIMELTEGTGEGC